MTSDCPTNSRKLDTDGTVLVCVTPHMDHEVDGDGPLIHYVTTGNDGRGLVLHAWPDDHPCAWSATCPACKGVRNEYGERVGCTRCGGAGTVDTIPAEMIGVGSVVADGPDREDLHLVLSVRDDGTCDVIMLQTGDIRWDVECFTGDAPEWSLVRAVPPAGDTT